MNIDRAERTSGQETPTLRKVARVAVTGFTVGALGLGSAWAGAVLTQPSSDDAPLADPRSELDESIEQLPGGDANEPEAADGGVERASTG